MISILIHSILALYAYSASFSKEKSVKAIFQIIVAILLMFLMVLHIPVVFLQISS